MANEIQFDLSDPMVAKVNATMESVRAELMAKQGVIGVGVGMKRTGGVHDPETIAIRVYVRQRKSATQILDADRVPGSYKAADGTVIPTDVMEIGSPRLFSFYGKYRPAKYGAVIGESTVVNDGTLGMVVKDNTDNSDVILSASHVLSNWNMAPIGSPILQPGAAHGGVNPGDKIGNLKRFIPVDTSNGGINYVDAAICTIDAGTVQKKTMCSYINLSKDYAVGLLFAGSDVMTIINPIGRVLSDLNCSYARTKTASVGMTIKKCGAATEYTTAVITDINATIMLAGEDGLFEFRNQILTAGGVSDAAAGDSGAIWFTN